MTEHDAREVTTERRPAMDHLFLHAQTTSQDPLHQCEVELIMSYGVTHSISNVSELLL
jgi:hypothetical protein